MIPWWDPVWPHTHSHTLSHFTIWGHWWRLMTVRDLMMVMTSDNNDDTSYLIYLMTMMTTDYWDKCLSFFLVFLWSERKLMITMKMRLCSKNIRAARGGWVENNWSVTPTPPIAPALPRVHTTTITTTTNNNNNNNNNWNHHHQHQQQPTLPSQ